MQRLQAIWDNTYGLLVDDGQLALGALAGVTATGVFSMLAPPATVQAYAGPVLLRRYVGFVFQTPVMFPGTVRDNLQAALTLGGAAGQGAERRVAAAMALAELDSTLCARDGDRLSGGQKQRVNIARALMTSPDVLLMDEPTSALDPETADRLMETTRRLSQEQHLTVVMVTHRLSEARRTSDMTVVLERGRVVAMGRPADVFEHTTNPRLRAFLETER